MGTSSERTPSLGSVMPIVLPGCGAPAPEAQSVMIDASTR
jgi:hypothetical protein